MDRRMRPEPPEARDDDFARAPEDLSLVDDVPSIDDVPNIPAPDVIARRKPPFGPKPGKETPGGWRR